MKIPIRFMPVPAILLRVFLYHCSTDDAAVIEITNGDCTEKIYNENRSPAVGATVRLLPAGYDPSSPSNSSL